MRSREGITDLFSRGFQRRYKNRKREGNSSFLLRNNLREKGEKESLEFQKKEVEIESSSRNCRAMELKAIGFDAPSFQVLISLNLFMYSRKSSI